MCYGLGGNNVDLSAKLKAGEVSSMPCIAKLVFRLLTGFALETSIDVKVENEK